MRVGSILSLAHCKSLCSRTEKFKNMSYPEKEKDGGSTLIKPEGSDKTVPSSTNADNTTGRHIEDTDTAVSHTFEENVEESDNATLESQEIVQNINYIEFKIVWNKQSFLVKFDEDMKIEELKEHIEPLTGIPMRMQKLMYKGLIKDDQSTLQQSGICKGAKVMVVGSTLKDVMMVTPPTKDKQKELCNPDGGSSKPEPLSSQKEHKKILDKGIPDDVMPGIIGIKEKLPFHPLSGMYNKRGGKVRLTFKLEVDQLWLGTKERTEKIPMSSIRSIISEPISDHKEYHIMGIQLGPTDASRYWVYWVPAQYIEAIKDTVLGRWQSF